MASPIDTYLRALRRELRGRPLLARRVLEETADHLAAAAAAAREAGMSQHAAEEEAVRRFGPPDRYARQFDRFTLPLRALLAAATASTVLVGLWLAWVLVAVLPVRDPGHIPLWRGVALGFFAYAGLSWAFLVAGPRRRALLWSLLVASAAAVGLAAFGVVSMLRAAAAGGEFEGYILLMGILLGGHGLAALAYATLAGRIARQVRATAG